jgi:hypothetical protein
MVGLDTPPEAATRPAWRGRRRRLLDQHGGVAGGGYSTCMTFTTRIAAADGDPMLIE